MVAAVSNLTLNNVEANSTSQTILVAFGSCAMKPRFGNGGGGATDRSLGRLAGQEYLIGIAQSVSGTYAPKRFPAYCPFASPSLQKAGRRIHFASMFRGKTSFENLKAAPLLRALRKKTADSDSGGHIGLGARNVMENRVRRSTREVSCPTTKCG
jgi:hypothetical protein